MARIDHCRPAALGAAQAPARNDGSPAATGQRLRFPPATSTWWERKSLTAPMAVGPMPWPKMLISRNMMAAAVARMRGSTRFCATARVGAIYMVTARLPIKKQATVSSADGRVKAKK